MREKEGERRKRREEEEEMKYLSRIQFNSVNL